MLLQRLFKAFNNNLYPKSIQRYFCVCTSPTRFEYNAHGVAANILSEHGIGELCFDSKFYGRYKYFKYCGVLYDELPGHLASHFNMTPKQLQYLLYLPITDSWRVEAKWLLENPLREYKLNVGEQNGGTKSSFEIY